MFSSIKASRKWGLLPLIVLVVTLSQIFIIFVILQFCNIPIVNFNYDEKTRETQTAKQLKLQDDSVFATSVPLSDNTACAAFTSTPERAHQKSNITVADVSEISASEHEIGRM